MDEHTNRQAARDAFLDAVSAFQAKTKEELRGTVRDDGELDEMLLQAVLSEGYLESQSAAPEEALHWFRAKSPDEQAKLGRAWLRGQS